MVAQPKPSSYEFVPLPSTSRVLPDGLRELKTFSFWRIPGAKKEKQPAHWNGSKWIFTEWQEDKNLEWVGDALHLSRELKVNIGLVVPECWVVIDFDQCRDPVTADIHPTVQRIIERLQTVVLLSSSGTGLHVFLKYTPDQPLPDETRFTNPDLYLDIFEKKKQGELKKPRTFVAINWHPLLGHNALDKTVQQFPEWLEAELFIREETAPLTEPSEPTPSPTPVSTPQAGTPREPGANDTPFGQRWKSTYLPYARTVLGGFAEHLESSNDTPSEHVYRWVMLYYKGVKNPNWQGAIEMSRRAESLVRSLKPAKEWGNKKKNWHEQNVTKVLFELSRRGQLYYNGGGEKLGKNGLEVRLLEALNWSQNTKQLPRSEKVLMQIMKSSDGLTKIRLTNREIEELTELSEPTIKRAKQDLRECPFLKIAGNKYTILDF